MWWLLVVCRSYMTQWKHLDPLNEDDLALTKKIQIFPVVLKKENI